MRDGSVRRRALLSPLVLTLALLVGSACSGGSGDVAVPADATDTPARSATAAATATPEATPTPDDSDAIPPDIQLLLADVLDVSGTWSQRPSPNALAPGPNHRGNTEVLFDEQVCVDRGGSGDRTCRFADWVYGRDWITLEAGEARTVTEGLLSWYEVDYTGVYHHVHTLRHLTERRSIFFTYSLEDTAAMAFPLVGTLTFKPGPETARVAKAVLSLRLTGELEGPPPAPHFTEVVLGGTLSGLGKTNEIFLGRSTSQDRTPDGVFRPRGGSLDQDEPTFITPFYRAKASPDGFVIGRVTGRLSGLHATSGTVFVYGEDPDEPLGSDEVDGDGYFVVTGLPIMRTEAAEDAAPGVGGARFTVTIDDAEAAIPVEDRSTYGGGPTVYFAPGTAVAYPFVTANVRLDAYAEPGIKRQLATALSELSKRHYADVEAPVFEYIERVVRDSIADAEMEALRRGAWAERILLEAARDADVMITDMTQALASMLGNLWDDFFNRKSDDLKKLGAAQSKANKLKGARSANEEVTTFFRFGLKPGDEHFHSALSAVQTSMGNATVSKMANAVKVMFKSLKMNLSLSFEEAGIGSEDAQKLGDAMLWLFDMVFRTMLAGFTSQTGSGALKPLGGAAIQGAVTATAPMLFDNQPGEIFALFPGSQAVADTFPSYTEYTAPALADSVDRMIGWNSSYPAGYELDAETAALALVSISNEFTIVKQRVDAAATFTDIGDTSADLASLADRIPVLKAVFVLAKIVQYTSNSCGIVEPMRFTFAYLPAWVEYGVATAYGDDPAKPEIGTSSNVCSFFVDGLMDVVEFFDDKANQVLHSTSGRTRQTGPSPIGSRSVYGGSVQDAGDRYVQALRSIAAELSADRLFQASAATGAPDGDLALTERAWAELKTELTMKTSAAPSSAWRDVGGQVSTQLVADLAELALQGGFRQEIADLVLDVLLGAYEEPSDAEFIARRDSVVATIERLIDEIESQQARLTLIEAALPEIETAIVIVSSSPPVSTSTGASFVSRRGEEFTITARIRNIGSLPAEGISVALTSLSDESVISLLTSSDVSISGDVLAASDGVAGSGSDEATVDWRIRYDAEPGAFPALFDLVVLENDGAPATFEVFDRTIELPVDFRATDADSDGMADQFERAYGLDTSADDFGDDRDGDGVTNGDEYRFGTDPTNPDSDGDGLTDGEELTEGDDDLVTDPLEPNDEPPPAP